jgi:hypothetical protein
MPTPLLDKAAVFDQRNDLRGAGEEAGVERVSCRGGGGPSLSAVARTQSILSIPLTADYGVPARAAVCSAGGDPLSCTSTATRHN